MPSGTVLTMVQLQGQAERRGRAREGRQRPLHQDDELAGIAVMEKRTGWGTEYPDDIRNGEWEYQAFKADKTVNDKANLKACFTCHKPLDKQDFVFSFDKMKTAK